MYVFCKPLLLGSLFLGAAVAQAQSAGSAVVETNLGQHSTRVQVQGGGSASIKAQTQGDAPLVIKNSTGPAPSSTAGGQNGVKQHVNADFSGRNWAGANLAGQQFTNVDLSSANLSGANLRAARLVNVSLERADLRGADLTGAQLVNVSLQGAQTQGAIWTDGQKR